MKIYTASKTIHAEKWRSLRASGRNVVSTWIDEAGPGETSDFQDLWKRCIDEASQADLLLLYREPGEVLKGALIEAGAALANGVSVCVIGPTDGYSFISHPLVVTCKSLEVAIHAMRFAEEVMLHSTKFIEAVRVHSNCDSDALKDCR